MFLRKTWIMDYNETKEGDRAKDRKMKLCNTPRYILYYSYIIGNTVGKAPTQEGRGLSDCNPNPNRNSKAQI
jgi:hypothetical protein